MLSDRRGLKARTAKSYSPTIRDIVSASLCRRDGSKKLMGPGSLFIYEPLSVKFPSPVTTKTE